MTPDREDHSFLRDPPPESLCPKCHRPGTYLWTEGSINYHWCETPADQCRVLRFFGS